MGQKIRQWGVILLVLAVASAFLIAGLFFTVILLLLWGGLAVWMRLTMRMPKGTIATKGQIIAVDYTVLDEKIVSEQEKE